ncbi:OLC1v1012974C1 [Oldenlandia corymbosa var. corymbosa]|uniref:RING-type E3 ubiquitin transferase n=1 Tax=Oldenlandia corymbosa var. corymbosa TaxID=529605 RepID=A0AAV1DX99_OLDCO|nr:OLC1v1012974C1 [Oldenlandia corymbosa var. corymbosa]
MAGNGKFRIWKMSIYKSSSSSSASSPRTPPKPDPPNEFLCPISGSLMADPVVVSSGQTFERASVQVCKVLGFCPTLSDGSVPDFSAIIPNLALKSSIINWCRNSHMELPSVPDSSSIESKVRNLTAQQHQGGDPGIRFSEMELLKGVEDNPRVNFSHAETELNARINYSSSSEESVIANGISTPQMLPFTQKPACYSSSSSSASTSFEMGSNPSSSSTGEDEVFLMKFKSLDVVEQEQGVVLLRKTTRNDEEARVTLCTPRLLQGIKPLLISRYPVVQTNSAAAIVNLSLAKVNKIKIVRSGVVPLLIDLLKGGFEESKEHAAGAIFSLALEDDNKTAIGVLGALQPLLHALRSGTESTRRDSALALYHLTLVNSNRVRLIKLEAVGVLLGMLRTGVLVDRVVLVVCNLAVSSEGRSALLDGDAVECLVAILRGGGDFTPSESTRENCVAALFLLSHGSMRFKGLAREARAAEVLQIVVERGSERAKEKARRILVALRGRDEEEDGGEIDWEGVMRGGLSRTRCRVPATHSKGLNSTEF